MKKFFAAIKQNKFMFKGMAPNNSFNASGISTAFIRKTRMLVSLCAAALIRALG